MAPPAADAACEASGSYGPVFLAAGVSGVLGAACVIVAARIVRDTTRGAA